MPASPREVFERHRRAITARAWSELSQLYAEDVVVDLPFNLPEPLRLQGREQLHARFLGGASLPLEMEMHNLVVHETLDPEVIVAEFDYHGRMTDGSGPISSHGHAVGRIRQVLDDSSHRQHLLAQHVYQTRRQTPVARFGYHQRPWHGQGLDHSQLVRELFGAEVVIGKSDLLGKDSVCPGVT